MDQSDSLARRKEDYAGEFAMLAKRYRQVAALLVTLREGCGESTIESDPVLKIAFTQVVSYIEEGAAQLEQAALALAPISDEGLASAVRADASAASALPLAFGNASDALRLAAGVLEGSMNRALDLSEEAEAKELLDDPHPYAHIVQGICLPYLLLASDVLDKASSS